MDTQQISGVILTHNNKRTIEKAVQSIAHLVSELVIVDDFSTDDTLDIVRRVYPKVKIVQRKLDRFDHQRNFSLQQVSHPWVLCIDSDEALDIQAQDSIKNIMNRLDDRAYGFYRLNQSFNRFTKERLNRPILFKRELTFQGALHEVVAVSITYLPGYIYHFSWKDMTEALADMNQYATHQAKKWIMQERNYSVLVLVGIAFLMPPYHFLKLYVGQKRFRNGFFAGFLYSALMASEWVWVVLKYYEFRFIHHMKNPEDIK